MRRYWIEKDKLTAESVVIDGDNFRHICVVCRQEVGDRFEVIADHKAYLVELVELGKKNALGKIIESRAVAELAKPHIHLALSLPKFPTLDKVLEKSVELGVHTVHLFSSDFSFMKPKPTVLEKKQERWRKIIQGATQQTGRGDLMELTEIQPLSVLLEEGFKDPQAAGLLAYEGEGAKDLKSRLDQLDPSIENIWIFVGSEGGFSENDVELFKDYGLLPISLGDQVLRVETACVTLVSILKYGLGHFD